MRDIQARGVLDYVCNWYVKAAEYIQDIVRAFDSTNSISQGNSPEFCGRIYSLSMRSKSFSLTGRLRGRAGSGSGTCGMS